MLVLTVISWGIPHRDARWLGCPVMARQLLVLMEVCDLNRGHSHTFFLSHPYCFVYWFSRLILLLCSITLLCTNPRFVLQTMLSETTSVENCFPLCTRHLQETCLWLKLSSCVRDWVLTTVFLCCASFLFQLIQAQTHINTSLIIFFRNARCLNKKMCCLLAAKWLHFLVCGSSNCHSFTFFFFLSCQKCFVYSLQG